VHVAVASPDYNASPSCGSDTLGDEKDDDDLHGDGGGIRAFIDECTGITHAD
jgi:hypothetical protein